ncbi:MAG: energy transducer TonB [Terriglobales bacterium]|jgi:TonB family protein
MSFHGLQRVLVVGLLISGSLVLLVPQAWGQEEGTRKTKVKVPPSYPELARKMKIAGVVKVQAVVAPNGTVKDMKLIGGHPVLASAVMDAVRKWRYEARPQETTEILEFRFDPNE